MAQEMDELLAVLGKQRRVRLLERTTGTVLIELEHNDRTERWYVNVKRGDVSVSRTASAPDCVVRTKASTFKAILAGQMNLMAAVLRGLLSIEGNVALVVALQGLFRPSAGAAEQTVAGYAGRPR